MSNRNLLKILFVDDVTSDVDLAVLELRKEKLMFEYITVCTRVDLINALKEFRPNLVISDYSMPSFNGLQALKEVKEFNPEIPFILYTGSINEETAVESIKAGAADYVIKERMIRLPFAVKEALEKIIIQKEKNASDLLLKDNEEKLQSIFSAAPIGIGLVVKRIIIEVNDTFCKMTGYTRNELIGKSSELIYATWEEYISAGIEKNRQISKTGIGSVETRFKCKDGRFLNILLNTAPLDKDDLIRGVSFTAMDITEQKRAAETLNEIQHLFKTLALVSPVGIFRTDPDGYTTYVNPKYSELTDLSLEEAMGSGWLNAVHPDDKEKLKESWLSDFKSRKISNSEYRFLKSDGSIVWVMGNAVPEWIDNEIVGYIGTVTDITGRKQSEKALQESEEQYRMIFENVQDLYYETLIDGTILEVSPSIHILSKGQYLKSDLVGKSMYDLYYDNSERVALISKIKEQGTITDFEIALKNKDGSRVTCSVSAKICFDTDGRPEKIIGSMHDITDRKNTTEKLKLAKEKAEASDKLKTAFLNNVSHEVRTPLNGILGFAEIISNPSLSEEEKTSSFSMLHESSDRLLNTITNYMDISLITSGNMSVHTKTFFPGQLLRKCFDNYKTICSNRNLELLLNIPEQSENLLVKSDPEIIQKIISHLLNNAVKFTEKGKIDFGYLIHDQELEFFVKDTGIGIGKESISTIFERFVKEDHGPTKLSEGSGLGLPIAKGMIDILGGKIRVESERGLGSGFYFSIPLMIETEKVPSGTPG